MRCKDCIHYEVCQDLYTPNVLDYINGSCINFENQSEWVRLPCKVGDTVYQVDAERIYKSRVKQIIYDTDNIAFDERAIGKTVFLTHEEAERKLKERESNA